ncbi:MAG: YdiU family protein [Alphaproteobacteria bacterium]|nr:YdiU family protein [Alphaproteobacteria bacterium]
MTLMIPFDNSYARLPEIFYSRISPVPVRLPELVALNSELARNLGLDVVDLRRQSGVDMLSGNFTPKKAEPIAQAYAGHQFGGWVLQLGDGRAVLLGEVIDQSGMRHDIQLKGSGRTPYSRGGDGRAWLGPVLREYVISEAMSALNIPTTRALAVVTTGEQVARETSLPGAVLTRIASSHIRIGTFQYFAARGDVKGLQTLTDYSIARHYPDAIGPLGLLQAVIQSQARLIAQWMGVGFIHGVMNTDNTHMGGITLDYGPCAYMDGYNPAQVFSSIDRAGRYAYKQQPEIIVWNLVQLATCLISLMGDDQKASIAMVTEELHQFAERYHQEWHILFRAKLGLAQDKDGDAVLINDLLALMAEHGADFTNTFRALSEDNARDQFDVPEEFDEWRGRWQARRDDESSSEEQQIALMCATSPALVARNHRIEQMINAAIEGDYAPFERLNAALAQPFDTLAEYEELSRPPIESEKVTQTFCGT